MECPPPQLHRRRRRPEAWIPALEAPTTFHFLVFVHGRRRLLSRPEVAPFPADGFRASSSPSETDATPPHLALLLEVEGVLADIYRSANRHAFNGGGDEERMLVVFFNRIGWPTSLPTSEKENFMKSVLREKKANIFEYQDSKLLSINQSETEQLGTEQILKIKIIGLEEIEERLCGQLISSNGISSSLEEQLAKEVNKAASAVKQKIASEVSSLLKLSVDIDISVCESLEKIVCTLRAGAEFAGVPIQNCVLIAGSKLGVFGAERIAMPCIVVRNSFTSRAEFPSARAIMDGFGGADPSISKILQKRWS